LLNKAYKYAIAYFLLFTLLLLVSATLLFADKIGFSSEDILHYYLGNQTTYTPAKTYAGILKIILPHIFGFGLFLMTLLHFTIFTKQRDTKEMQWLIYLSFFIAFLELFTPFMILAGFESFALLKLLSFFGFELLIIYAFFILFKSLLYN